MNNSPHIDKKVSEILSRLSDRDIDVIRALPLENKKEMAYKIICTCPICKKERNGKTFYKPNACFIETKVGWKYTCRKCNSTLWMYEYLTKTNNKNDAREYVKGLWKDSIFGYGWNYPNYPESLLIRLYSELEDDEKDSNYQMKYQSSMS